jgi:hypothetical protein
VEPRRFYCAECGGLAATLILRAPFEAGADPEALGHDQWRLEVDGPVSVEHWVLRDLDRLQDALRTESIAALRAINEEYVHFWCPHCAATYCGEHWRPIEPVMDEGFYDATYGTCPRGHRVMLDD